MTNDRGQAQVLRTEPGRQMLRRALVLAALFGVVLFALLLGRLAQLQIAEHDRFGAAAAAAADAVLRFPGRYL